MKLADRVVTYLPMQRLWTDAEELRGTRMAELSAADVANLLRTETVFFAVADVGHKLHWIEVDQRFKFWKDEGQPHLASPAASIEPAALPGGYAYTASLWSGTDTAPIILLEKLH
jgi:hypothetical protein